LKSHGGTELPPTLEERVAYLEGKVEEHSGAWEDLKDMIINLDQKVDGFRGELSSRIDSLDQRFSSRIDSLDQRFSSRIDSLDQKVDRRIDALEQKFSRYFLWIIGIQVTIFLSIIATLLKS